MPSVGRLVRYTIAVIGVLIIFYVLYRIVAVLVLFAVAILLATAIEPVVLKLRRGPFSRGQGILVAYTAIFAVLGLVVFFVISTIGSQGNTLTTSLPASLGRLRQGLNSVGFAPLRSMLDGLFTQLQGTIQQPAASSAAPETAKQVGAGVFAAVFDVVTVFVLAFYWLTERTIIKRGFTGLFDAEHRPTAISIWNDVEERLGGWVRGQMLLMLTIGVSAAIGWSIIGVPFALVLAIVAGLVEIVPILGPWLGTAPAVLAAFTVSPEKALLVLVYGVVIQLLEANVLVPRIMRNSTGITPLTVLLGILVGSALGGIVGALLAVPAAASLQVLLQNLQAAGNLPSSHAASRETPADEGAEGTANGAVDDTVTAEVVAAPQAAS